MTELETYKKALQKISKYGIKPTGETELQRIKRLKSIADKALFIADVSKRSELLIAFMDYMRYEYGNGAIPQHNNVVERFLKSNL
jgi:hypothetical protein